MRRNQRLLAGENQIGTSRRRSLLMTSSVSVLLGANCRPIGGSAKVFAMGDTENGCAVTGHSQVPASIDLNERQELACARCLSQAKLALPRAIPDGQTVPGRPTCCGAVEFPIRQRDAHCDILALFIARSG